MYRNYKKEILSRKRKRHKKIMEIKPIKLRLDSIKLTYSPYMTIAISYKCTTQLSEFQSSHSANPCNFSALVDW